MSRSEHPPSSSSHAHHALGAALAFGVLLTSPVAAAQSAPGAQPAAPPGAAQPAAPPAAAPSVGPAPPTYTPPQ